MALLLGLGGAEVRGVEGTEAVEITRTGRYYKAGVAHRVAVDGPRAYLAAGRDGLEIVDVSNPEQPQLLGRWQGKLSEVRGVAVEGSHAYVADWNSGLQVVDVSLPASLVTLGGVGWGSRAWDVEIAGDMVAIAADLSGLVFVTRTNPANPQIAWTCPTAGPALAVAVAGTHAYVAEGEQGLQVFDFSGVEPPRLVGAWDSAGSAVDVAVAGNLALIADSHGGLQILSLSNPASPEWVGSHPSRESSLAVAAAGNLAYLAVGHSGLEVVDLSNPAQPRGLGWHLAGGTWATAVAVAEPFAYLVTFHGAMEQGLEVFRVLPQMAATPPVVFRQPQSRLVHPGDLVVLSAWGSGSATLDYRWEKLGGGVVGADLKRPSLVMSNVQPEQAGSYIAWITNRQGRATTDVATITVLSSGAMLYQTDFNGLKTGTIHGQDGWEALYLGNPRSWGDVIDLGNGNKVLAVAGGTAGSPWGEEVRRPYDRASSKQFLTVEFDFRLVDSNGFWFMDHYQPNQGGPDSLFLWGSGLARSNADPPAQLYFPSLGTWHHLGIEVDQNGRRIVRVNYDGTWSAEDDRNGITAPARLDRFIFRGQFSGDPSGPAYPVVWVDNLRIYECDEGGDACRPPSGAAPVITEEPADQSVEGGALAQFTLRFTGNPTPGCRWQKAKTPGDWTWLAGATAETLLLERVEFGDGAAYRAVVTNALGSVTSRVATLTVRPPPSTPNLARLGVYQTAGSALGLAVAGRHAFVASGWAGVEAVDFSDPVRPRGMSRVDTPGEAIDVALGNGVAAVADGLSDLQVIGIANPMSLTWLGAYSGGGPGPNGLANGVAFSGNHAWVANGNAGLQAIDVSNPGNPVWVGGFDTPGWAANLVVQGDRAYVADTYDGGLLILDVSQPGNPVLLGQLDTPGEARSVAVAGEFAFVADGIAGVQVIDVRRPSQPVAVGWLDTPGNAQGVAAYGRYVLVADLMQVTVLEVVDPAHPISVLTVPTPCCAREIVMSGNYVYVAEEGSGLEAFYAPFLGSDRPPVFTAEPQDQGVWVGGTARLTASFNYTPTLECQWQKESGGAWISLPGETRTPLILDQVQVSDAGLYRVLIANGQGMATSRVATLTVSAPAALSEGLIAHWPLDEVQVGRTPDMVNGYDLELGNLTSANLGPGVSGRCFGFDQAWQTLLWRVHEPGDALPANQHAAFTVVFWIQALGTGRPDHRWFAEGSTTSDDPLFSLGSPEDGSDNSLALVIRQSGWNPVDPLRTEGQPLDLQWHHVAFVQHADGSRQLYLDGAPDPRVIPAREPGPWLLNTTSLGGLRQAAGSAWGSGFLDEVGVWKRALTGDEIQSVRSSGIPRSNPRILGQPAPVTVPVGSPAIFKVAFEGDPAPACRWERQHPDGTWTPIDGATGFEWVLPGVQAADSGAYRAVVSNAVAVVRSRPAVLAVTTPIPAVEIARVGKHVTPGGGWDVVVEGSRIYLAGGSSGLEVLDATDPAHPLLWGAYDTPGRASGVAVSGGLAFVADGTNGLAILEASNPDGPRWVGGAPTGGQAHDLALFGSLAVIASLENRLQFVDVQDPVNPRMRGDHQTLGRAIGVFVSGNLVFVAEEEQGIEVFQCHVSLPPRWIGRSDTPGSVRQVTGDGRYLYVADGSSGLQVLDAADPGQLRWMGAWKTRGSASAVAVSGSCAFVALGRDGLEVVDVSRPDRPQGLGWHQTEWNAWSVAAAGEYAYVGTYSGNASQGLEVFRVRVQAEGTAPAILVEPVGASVVPGGLVSLDTWGAGSAPLSYRWRREEGPVLRADPTRPSLVISNAQPDQAGSYFAVVTNLWGAATSRVAVLTVGGGPPSITTQPVSLAGAEGSRAGFSVAAQGSPPLAYRWARNGTPLENGPGISGATTNRLVLTGLTAADEGGYSVTVSNAWGWTVSAPAWLRVWPGVTPSDPHTTLHLSFDDTLVGAQGELPTAASGVEFVPGMIGSGVWLNEASRLIYESTGNISETEGTLECWIRPAWSGSDPQNHTILAWGTANGALFAKDGVGNLRSLFNRWGLVSPELGSSQYVGHWPAGAWRHVAFTWKPDAVAKITVCRLYLDGVLVRSDTAAGVIHPPTPAGVPGMLRIGGEQEWGDGNLLAVLDELSLSDVERTPGEIAASHRRVSQGAAPYLAVEPADRLVRTGEVAKFSVTAVGDTPLRFAWHRVGAPLIRSKVVPEGHTLILDPVESAMAGGYCVVVTNWAGSVTSRVAQLVVTDGPATPPPPYEGMVVDSGFLVRDLWRDPSISTNLDSLRNLPRFMAGQPDVHEVISFTASHKNWGDHYGQRLWGLVVPEVTGDHVLAIAADHAGELLLSRDAHPAHRQRIASATQSSSMDWNRDPVQRSMPIYLQAGQPYFIEVLMVEAEGDDHLSIAWMPPGAFSLWTIPDRCLRGYCAPGTASLALTRQPVDQNVPAGASASFGVTAAFATEFSGEAIRYQWQSNRVDVGGALGPEYVVKGASMAMSGTRYRCVVDLPGVPPVVSDEVTLTVVPDDSPLTLLSVIGDTTLGQVRMTFSKPLDITVSTNRENFVFDGGLAASWAYPLADPRTLLVGTSRQAPGTTYTVQVTGVRDVFGVMIDPGTSGTFTSASIQTGSIARAVWHDPSIRLNINTLLSLPRFLANQPDEWGTLASLEAPTDVGSYYGQRLSGLLLPPVTGEYRFLIAADDMCRLYVGTNESPSSRVLAAYHDGWTYPREWFKYPTQTSAPIPLVAGRAYYVEALMTEELGGDNLAVSWILPGAATNTIPAGAQIGSLLVPGGIAILQQPTNTTAAVGGVARFSIQAAVAPGLGDSPRFQWQRNGVNLAGAVGSTYLTPTLSAFEHGARFRCVVWAPGVVPVTSDEATLSVSPGLRMEREPVPEFLRTPAPGSLAAIPVVMVKFLPTADGVHLDATKAPDYWELNPIPLARAHEDIRASTERTKFILEEGSRFRAYAHPGARPSLGYRVVDVVTFYEHTPPGRFSVMTPNGVPAWYLDYDRILEAIGGRQYVDELGVREFWVWHGYFDGGSPTYDPALFRAEDARALQESNMSSPLTGDVSNSPRFDDLPVYGSTYTVYEYNLRRSHNEALENHAHQLEALLTHALTRSEGNADLF